MSLNQSLFFDRPPQLGNVTLVIFELVNLILFMAISDPTTEFESQKSHNDDFYSLRGKIWFRTLRHHNTSL